MKMNAKTTALLSAYVECAALLKWLVEHDGECLGDNPKALSRAKDALARTAETTKPCRAIEEAKR